MYLYEKLITYNFILLSQKNLKIKCSILKALQQSDEQRLDKLVLENKDLKNKLENANFETLKKFNVSL